MMNTQHILCLLGEYVLICMCVCMYACMHACMSCTPIYNPRGCQDVFCFLLSTVVSRRLLLPLVCMTSFVSTCQVRRGLMILWERPSYLPMRKAWHGPWLGLVLGFPFPKLFVQNLSAACFLLTETVQNLSAAYFLLLSALLPAILYFPRADKFCTVRMNNFNSADSKRHDPRFQKSRSSPTLIKKTAGPGYGTICL